MSNTGIYNANTHNTDQNIYSRQNFKQYNTNKSNICGISDDKTDCSRQSAFCDSTNYADLPLGCVCEGTEVRNSADENVKIYNIKHSSAYLASSQNATALAAATFRESTPCDIGIFTV